MGKKNKGHENLIPFSERSKDEAREKGRKGGIASGKTRREKANMRKLIETFLDSKIEGKDMTYAEWAGWKEKSGRTALNDLNGLAKPVTIKSIERVKALPSSILDESGQKK